MKLNNKGFSLVELLIAIAVSTIVLGAVTAMIVYSSNSLRDTNARVEVQNQAKDAMNHIEGFCMEAVYPHWDEDNNALLLFTDKKEAKAIISGSVSMENISTLTSDTYIYWFNETEKKMYFGKCSFSESGKTDAEIAAESAILVNPDALPTDSGNLKNYLLANYVEGFECKVRKNEESGNMLVDIEMKYDSEMAPKYYNRKTVYLRNQ